MANIRIIARLDIRAPNLIKAINLEGVKIVGDPRLFAQRYYLEGIDEILYMDVVATLYGRNSLVELVSDTAAGVFVPMTVGGGIKTVEEVDGMLRAGADKISINTAAINNPDLINKISRRFGSQCMVLSIEAKRRKGGGFEAYTDNGREKTGREVVEWAKEAVERGTGEILLTSVDQEGTCSGFDVELVKAVSEAVSVPIIASGGMGRVEDVLEVIEKGGASAIAIAHMLHYNKVQLEEIRNYLKAHQYTVREV